MATVFINDLHYDNACTDAGEFIEIAGPAGTSLAGWQLVLYNGNPTQRTVYNTLNLTGTIPDLQNGYGTLSFAYAVNGIQNGGSGASGSSTTWATWSSSSATKARSSPPAARRRG